MRKRTTTRVALATMTMLSVAIACGPSEPGNGGDPAGGGWVGDITTDGNVTTVVNASGSVWGGPGLLIEEASIGVDAGDDPYMLGSVRALAVHDDEIYVLDPQIPTIRVYDLNGVHRRDLGSAGEGPGEFRRPDSMVFDPDGNLYVRDTQANRISILSPDGEERGTLQLDRGFSSGTPLAFTTAGILYNYERAEPDAETGERVRGLFPIDEHGERGAPILAPDFGVERWILTASNDGGMSITYSVPFAPATRWTLAPSGAVVAGVSDDYRFEIRRPDATVMIIEKHWEPVPVDPEEAAGRRRQVIDSMRRSFPEYTWNGPEIPPTKPAFSQLIPDRNGRIWVTRSGPGTYDAECETPRTGLGCWVSETLLDLFDVDGRYLGPVEVPAGLRFGPLPFIDDDLIVATVTDELGTVMVKRYRLAPPGEQSP